MVGGLFLRQTNLREFSRVHFATWRSEDADADGYWTLDACDAFGQRWLVHHDDLLAAVVLLGEMLGVDWEDG